jgi:hypothetical protein
MDGYERTAQNDSVESRDLLLALGGAAMVLVGGGPDVVASGGQALSQPAEAERSDSGRVAGPRAVPEAPRDVSG